MAVTNKNIEQTSIGEIVAADFRTAEIFRKAGIDFCCGGKNSLSSVCNEKGIKIDFLKSELKKVEESPRIPSLDFDAWSLDFLCDYIVNTHHNYVLKTLPELVFYTTKIAQVHGEHHPELVEVAELFSKINGELLQHLKKEEEVLFPAIRNAVKEDSAKQKGVITEEITRMWGEHEFAGGAMDKIRQITCDYSVPADGCNTYQVTFRLLEQFEDDLHIHVHLENNILFPKALETDKD